MTDHVPRDDAERLLDEAHRLAENGKYESAAGVYTELSRGILDMSAERGAIDESEKASELSDLSLLNASHSGKGLYDAVTGWYSDIRDEYDIVLEPRGGPGGDGPGGDGPGGEDDRYGRNLDVSVDIRNAEGAEASGADPFEPNYSVSLTAMAGSETAARDYVEQTLADSDGLAVAGVDETGSVTPLGEYDLAGKDLDDFAMFGRSRRQTDGDTTLWTYEVDIPGVHAEVPWEIDDDGYYMIGAAFQGRGGDLVNDAAGHSDWFGVADTEDDDGDGYDGVDMRFDAGVPEEAKAGQVWNAKGRSGLSSILDAPAAFNKSVNPSYSLAIRAGEEEDLRNAVDDLEYLELRVGEVEESDIGPALAAGETLYEDTETYTLAVDEVDAVYRQGGDWVVHFDGFEPDGDAPRFDDGGVRVVQATGLDAGRNEIPGMVSAPDFLEVDDWTVDDAYDEVRETATGTWSRLQNSYLFGGKQETKSFRDVAPDKIKGKGVGRLARDIGVDVAGDGIYHEWIRPHLFSR